MSTSSSTISRTLLVLSLSAGLARADVTLPPLISDNMLLQQSKPVVWGKADPGEKVTVTLDKATASATADENGKWRVELPALKPGEAGTMTVEGKNKLSIKNVAVGEVWMAAGQSNMLFAVGGVMNKEREVADANYPMIRHFVVPSNASDTLVEDLPGKWEVCSPATVTRFSAVAYFFSRQLHKDLNVPIGIISAGWGGTSAQVWTPVEVTEGDPDFKKYLKEVWEAKFVSNFEKAKEKYEKEKAEGKDSKPPEMGKTTKIGVLYNGMIYGATPYSIKGIVWYQGESNAGKEGGPHYKRYLPAMIASWRKAWNLGDIPFLIVQLANYQEQRPDAADSYWAEIREAQRTTAETDPNSGLAVAIDIGDVKDIHPKNKQEVGRRLALIAEAKTYGKSIISTGPMFKEAKFNNGTVEVTFNPGTAVGLKTRDGGAVKGFAVAGADKKFVWADAKIVPAKSNGEPTIEVSIPAVSQPVAIRYGWAQNPDVNLVNEADLPASPFRTDDWPQVNSRPPKGSAPSAEPVIPES